MGIFQQLSFTSELHGRASRGQVQRRLLDTFAETRPRERKTMDS
jgi:hypothetical protein